MKFDVNTDASKLKRKKEKKISFFYFLFLANINKQRCSFYLS